MTDGYKGKPVNSLLFLILGFVTCGLGFLYWLWLIINDINKTTGRDVVGVPMFIVGILCLPVAWYNMYMIASAMPEVRQKGGLPAKDDTVLLVILAILFYPAFAFMIQEELNKMWGESPAQS
jgi:hypothetical protein